LHSKQKQYNTLKVGNGDGVSILDLFIAGSQASFLAIVAESRVSSLLSCTSVHIYQLQCSTENPS